MAFNRYANPEDLLAAYYAERGESLPGPDSLRWLRCYAARGNHADRDSLAYAETLLERAVVDVDDLAEYFLGCDLLLNDLRPFDQEAGAPVLGSVRPPTKVINVCFRAEAYRPLYRSTVMHDIAHLMLHADARSAAYHYAPTAKQRPLIEKEADRFMAAALLPEPILYLAIVLAGQPHGAAAGTAFGDANTKRGRWQWRYIYFPFFLDRMCLSRELVSIRMLERGTFTRETHEYHKTYAIPTKWRKPAPLTFERVLNSAFDDLMAGSPANH